MFDFLKNKMYNAIINSKGKKMIDAKRLTILTESAKYDVSCSSSGSSRKSTKTGLGNTAMSGICHSFTPDGRCISLIKLLMTNECIFDCQYCINRRSNDLPRAIASPDEICEIVIEFYKRNFIEGLFLSSAVYRSPDYTMELLLTTVIKLREEYGFNGYIHLKGIPGANHLLIDRAAAYADRMSFNIELPSEKSLKLLAPQKSKQNILLPMQALSIQHEHMQKEHNFKFLPAGQTTQMIVGASPENDSQIIRLTQALYKKFKLERVYYSSYVATNRKNPYLPQNSTGLLREHRLYQADWLLRFYGFTAEELLSDGENFSEKFDPKCAWAIKNIDAFPIEINKAPLEMLIKVPGIGFKSAYKIISARKYGKIQYEDLIKMKVVLKRAKHFITVNGKFYGEQKMLLIENSLSDFSTQEQGIQLSLFSDFNTTQSILTGQI